MTLISQTRRAEADSNRRTLAGLALAAVLLISGLLIVFDSTSSLSSTPLLKATVPSSTTATSPYKNIVFVLVDDATYGSLNVDDTRSMPFLDSTANNRIQLNNYYSSMLCTPARAALLTGKYTHKTGVFGFIVDPGSTWGLPTSLTLLPEMLQDFNYKTHLVGKWHLGHYTADHLPSNRGFESFFGYLCGEEHYYSHDFVDPLIDDGTGGGSWVFKTEFSDFSALSADAHEVQSDNTTYSTILYLEEVIDILEEHDQSQPLFLEIALQNVHQPIETPPDDMLYGLYMSPQVSETDFKAHLDTLTYASRHYMKSLLAVDNFLYQVLKTIHENNMEDNTIVVIASDNGGAPCVGGYAYPLRGQKGGIFNGGVKVDATILNTEWEFEEGLPLKYDGLFSVVDWIPTLFSLAGIDADLEGLDGVDHSKAFFDSSIVPRTYLPVHVGPMTTDKNDADLYALDDDDDQFERDTTNYTQFKNYRFAIINGDYKFMHEYYDGYYAGNSSSLNDDGNADDTNDDELEYLSCDLVAENESYYLYNITHDPYEQHNLLSKLSEEDEVTILIPMINMVIDELYSSDWSISFDTNNTAAAYCFKENDYFVGPFDSCDV